MAALFALHPLHVESVVWIAERKDVLSSLFFLLTLRAYVWYVRGTPGQAAEKDGERRNSRNSGAEHFSSERRPTFSQGSTARYLVVTALFVLGLLAKPMLVTLPLVMLLLDYWPLGRFGAQQAEGKGEGCWHRAGRLIVEKLPWLALVCASCVVTYRVQQAGGNMAPADELALSIRLGNAPLAYVGYLEKMFAPINLAPFYPHDLKLHLVHSLLATGLLVALSAVLLWAGRWRAYLTVGWLWYLGMLAPVIGVIQVGSQSMADRYTYLSLIGLFIIIAWGAADLAALWRRRSQGGLRIGGGGRGGLCDSHRSAGAILGRQRDPLAA